MLLRIPFIFTHLSVPVFIYINKKKKPLQGRYSFDKSPSSKGLVDFSKSESIIEETMNIWIIELIIDWQLWIDMDMVIRKNKTPQLSNYYRWKVLQFRKFKVISLEV